MPIALPPPSSDTLVEVLSLFRSRVALAILVNSESTVPLCSAVTFSRDTAAAAFARMCFAVNPGKKPFTTTTPPSVKLRRAKSSSRSFFDPNPYRSNENSLCSNCHHRAYSFDRLRISAARSFKCPAGSRPNNSLTVSSSARSSRDTDAADASRRPFAAMYPRPPLLFFFRCSASASAKRFSASLAMCPMTSPFVSVTRRPLGPAPVPVRLYTSPGLFRAHAPVPVFEASKFAAWNATCSRDCGLRFGCRR
mmetsp:Transcript_289/g.986  ORF Transcript_289/g.986 Transcript_289/m.986 type:complete len:251 (+) Transcript_289:1031-1783(+)